MSILETLQPQPQPEPPPSWTPNPWDKFDETVKKRYAQMEITREVVSVIPRLESSLGFLMTFFWAGKDRKGNEHGLTPVQICEVLGAEAATLFDALALLVQGLNKLKPNTFPETPVVTLNRLPSGWVWPGDLADKPEGWGEVLVAE